MDSVQIANQWAVKKKTASCGFQNFTEEKKDIVVMFMTYGKILPCQYFVFINKDLCIYSNLQKKWDTITNWIKSR